jgi:hypothetical protein
LDAFESIVTSPSLFCCWASKVYGLHLGASLGVRWKGAESIPVATEARLDACFSAFVVESVRADPVDFKSLLLDPTAASWAMETRGRGIEALREATELALEDTDSLLLAIVDARLLGMGASDVLSIPFFRIA